MDVPWSCSPCLALRCSDPCLSGLFLSRSMPFSVHALLGPCPSRSMAFSVHGLLGPCPSRSMPFPDLCLFFRLFLLNINLTSRPFSFPPNRLGPRTPRPSDLPNCPPRPPPIGPRFEAASDPSIRSLGARGRGQPRPRSRPHRRGGGVASSFPQNQGLRRSKLISRLVSRVVRKLVQVLMTFLMRRRTTLLTTLRTTFVMTSVACDAGYMSSNNSRHR